MDIRSLQQVIAIRKHGSFARAANALGVSQPNLSKSVARLEDELKLKLFDRTAKGSILTPIGEMIIERADAVITETRDLARDAALLAGGETGIVRIGCTTALMAPLLTPLVAGLVERHPELRIHAEVAASARLLPLLDDRELDVVFTGQAPGAGPSAYRSEVIFENPAYFVASPDHPLAGEKNISIPRLAQFKCAGAQAAAWSNARLLGYENENLGKYTTSNFETVLPLMLRGDAVLLTAAFLIQPYLEAGEAVILDVKWRQNAEFHFVSTRVASHSPIVSEIRGHARILGRRLADDWNGVASRFT